jgi:hypothetical protein
MSTKISMDEGCGCAAIIVAIAIFLGMPRFLTIIEKIVLEVWP